MPIKVGVVEDSPRLLAELQRQVNSVEGLVCVAACQDATTALRMLPACRPDVVIVDICLPDRSGIELIGDLKAMLPNAQVLILTVMDDYDLIFKALVAGAAGYLLKKSSVDRIAESVRELHEGGSPMSTSVARKVIRAFQQLGRTAGGIEKLSLREEEILECLSSGMRYKEIAERLNISVHTVRNHIHHIYEVLHVCSRKEAVNVLRIQSAIQPKQAGRRVSSEPAARRKEI